MRYKTMAYQTNATRRCAFCSLLSFINCKIISQSNLKRIVCGKKCQVICGKNVNVKDTIEEAHASTHSQKKKNIETKKNKIMSIVFNLYRSGNLHFVDLLVFFVSALFYPWIVFFFLVVNAPFENNICYMMNHGSFNWLSVFNGIDRRKHKVMLKNGHFTDPITNSI